MLVGVKTTSENAAPPVFIAGIADAPCIATEKPMSTEPDGAGVRWIQSILPTGTRLAQTAARLHERKVGIVPLDESWASLPKNPTKRQGWRPAAASPGQCHKTT